MIEVKVDVHATIQCPEVSTSSIHSESDEEVITWTIFNLFIINHDLSVVLGFVSITAMCFLERNFIL